jgi:ribosomal protein L18
MFVAFILSQEHCTVQITDKHLKHDLSHAYVLSKLVSEYLGSLE